MIVTRTASHDLGVRRSSKVDRKHEVLSSSRIALVLAFVVA